jgi:2-polyprenyl-3-methyl-5-hydroxy-6-metoxy-1,4-benzoquinol methylase
MITEHASDARQKLFDRYWQTREYVSADARTGQRTAYCARLMHHTHGGLLDVGCGRGYTARYFADRGFAVLGLDVSPLSVKWTQEQGIEARVIDLENDDFAGSFTVIVCLETLQYMKDPAAALNKLKKTMSADGEMIISLPCEDHIARRFTRRQTAQESAYARTTLTPAIHRRVIAEAGLIITDTLPISLVPPRRRLPAALGQLAVRLWPGGLALSVMYRLVQEHKL